MRVLSLLTAYALLVLSSCISELEHSLRDYNAGRLAKTAQDLRDEETLKASLAFDGIPEASAQ